ncbi:TPA: hypothetical protein NKX25_000437 [Vibrio parahaemolyticus]|nr:hypothetical protein [Vibrio parahaemolyticus]
MLSTYIGKRVNIVTGPEGEETTFGLMVIDTEGSLIKLKNSNDEELIINTASSNFFSLSES